MMVGITHPLVRGRGREGVRSASPTRAVTYREWLGHWVVGLVPADGSHVGAC
jgi:hypothetical protein